MNVFLLLENREQPYCRDTYGEPAWPTTSVVGVYEDRNRAEAEMNKLVEEDQARQKEDETDPCYYLIEERPVL